MKEIVNIVLDIVSEELGISREEMLSKNRSADVVDARSIAIKMLYVLGKSVKSLSEIFGRTTRGIAYALTEVDNRLSTNRLLRIAYERISKQVRSKLEASIFVG